MRRWWHAHSLTAILLVLAAVMVPVSAWTSWQEFTTNEQAGKGAVFFGREFLVFYAMSITTNFLSDVLGLLTIVLLTKWFRERFSAESS